MAKNLFLNIDDDVSRCVKKISAEKAHDLILVVPKQALLFSDPVNIKLLKKQLELLGKNVSFLTMDVKGQQYVLAEGFELRSYEHLRKSGPSMDLARRKSALAVRIPSGQKPITTSIPKIEPKFEPQPIEVERHFAVQPQPTPQPIAQAVTEAVPAAVEVYQQKFEQTIEEREEQQKIIEKQKKLRKMNRILVSGLLLALVVFLLLTLVILPQADITVYARTQPFSRDLPILIDKNAKDSNVDQLIIPGQLLNDDQTQNKQFSTTGILNTGNKALGQVQIYNFMRRTLKLGAATTTLMVGTQVYHFKTDVTGIKATEYLTNGRDIKASSLITPVTVIADQPGEVYNLPAGTHMEIHNDVLGSVPTLLYAISATNIDGGTSITQPQINQNDLDTAKQNLSNSVFDASSQQLQSSKGLTILSSGTNIQIQNISFDSKVGDQKSSFAGTVNAHLSGLAFDKTLVKKLVEQRIALTMDANKYFDTSDNEQITMDYKSGSVNLNDGNGILNVHIDGVIASKIDTGGLAVALNGKNALEAKEYLLSNADIDDANIVFKPFWVRTVPRFSGKVNIHVQHK